jgi:hypothetical protein
VEKLLNAIFIYPVPLTEWVSNPILVDKKKGIVCVCMDFRDLKKECPKDNLPTPFRLNHIDETMSTCVQKAIFSLMDVFSGYNQIHIKPKNQHKTVFFFTWGTFAYRKITFNIKNTIATFQRAMTFLFHDLKNIIEDYLDDLAAQSRKRVDHLNHLRIVFKRCHYYWIRSNLHK